MHEYSIVSALVERVEAEAGVHPMAIVRKLHLKIGELAGVEVDLLRTAFETLRSGGVCASAELDIISAPAEWRCVKCDELIARGAVLQCSTCARPARLVDGGEIILERIELEVPDV